MHSNLWRFQVAYLFYCKLKQRKHVKNSGNKAFQGTKEPKHTSNLSYSKFNLKLKATQSKLTFPQTLSSLGTGPRRTSSVSEVWLPRSCIAFNCSFNSLTSFELSSNYQPLFGKGARAPPPNSRLDSWTLALLILTNKKSACLNRAGCINYLSRSNIDVVRY